MNKFLMSVCLTIVALSSIGIVKAFSLVLTPTAGQTLITCVSDQHKAACYDNAGNYVGDYQMVSTRTASISFEEGVQ